MTSALAQTAGKKLFEQHIQQYAPADPLYEYYTDNKGRQKRRKREIPPGLSKRDAKVLKSVQRRAHYLDKGFHLCGMRFGWTFIIGIIPGAGDVADATLNYLLVVRKAEQADIPSWLLRRFLVNNAASFALGFIPLAGDIALAAFKANSRNAALLEEYLRIRGEEFLKAQESGPAAVSDKNRKEAKPGAGRKDGEDVEGEAAPATPSTAAKGGEKPEMKKGGSFWSRGGSKGKGKGKENELEVRRPGSGQGRFVEAIDSSGSEAEIPGRKKK